MPKSKPISGNANKIRETDSSNNNPFERKKVKHKREVLGQRRLKSKNGGNIGKSHLNSIENRKNTLLREYQQKGKTSSFVDNRFGESSTNLSQEEKNHARFLRERKKSSKANFFNIEDMEQDGEELTHGGTSLGDIRNFNDYEGDDEELDQEEQLALQRNIEAAVLEDGGSRSVRDVMAEVVAKSKFYRNEKAKEKILQEETVEELDSIWNDGLQNLISTSFKENENSIERQKQNLEKQEQEKNAKYNDFETTVRALQYENRSAPTDRKKTEQEIAIINRTTLLKLEQERKNRMDPNFNKQENDADEEGVPDFEYKDEETEKEILNEEIANEETQNNVNKKLVFEWASNLDQVKDHLDSLIPYQDLPFILEIPLNFTDFCILLYKRDIEQTEKIIQRLRVSNTTKVSPQNKTKMTRLYFFLVQWFVTISNEINPPRLITEEITKNNKKYLLILNSVLNHHLFEITHEISDFATNFWKERVSEIHALVTENNINLSTLLILKLITNLFPFSDFQHQITTPVLLILSMHLNLNGNKMISPKKNSPSFSLMLPSQFQQIFVFLFTCSLLFHCSGSVNRFTGEALNVLVNILTLTVRKLKMFSKNNQNTQKNKKIIVEKKGKKNRKSKNNQPQEKEIIFTEDLCYQNIASHSLSFLNKPNVQNINTNKRKIDEIDSNQDKQFYFFFLENSLVTATLFFSHYNSQQKQKQTELPLDILFQDLIPVLHEIQQEHTLIPKNIIQQANKLTQDYKTYCEEHKNRFHLTLQKKKPVPIKSFNPKVDEHFSVNHKYDSNRERAQMTKLQNDFKKEMKGAIRELKKDNWFIADQQAQEKAKKAKRNLKSKRRIENEIAQMAKQ